MSKTPPEYFAAYYQKHRDKLDAENKERNKAPKMIAWKRAYMKEYNKTYTENNRAKYNAKAMKRHAAKKQRTPPWLAKSHFDQIEIFYDASRRLSKELGIIFNVDHIIPLQARNVSGLHVPWNLQVIPRSENYSKRNSFKLEAP